YQLRSRDQKKKHKKHLLHATAKISSNSMQAVVQCYVHISDAYLKCLQNRNKEIGSFYCQHSNSMQAVCIFEIFYIITYPQKIVIRVFVSVNIITNTHYICGVIGATCLNWVAAAILDANLVEIIWSKNCAPHSSISIYGSLTLLGVVPFKYQNNKG
ncbi:hypothetical protein ACJX0J_023287, partial [Zea mays]